MNLRFKTTIQPIRALMPKAYCLHRKDVEEKRIQVAYQGVSYQVDIRLEYVGIECHISAEVGETQLLFEPNAADGIDILKHGNELPEGLINEIAIGVMRALE